MSHQRRPPPALHAAACGSAFALCMLQASGAFAGTIESASEEAVRGLGAVPKGAFVVAAIPVGDQPFTRPEALAARMAAEVARRLDSPTVSPEPMSVQGARNYAARASALLYVQVELQKGELRVNVDVYPVLRNRWQRIKDPLPASRAHGFAHGVVDAEIRTFLPTILLEQAKTAKAKLELSGDAGAVLAMACGDADGDGGNELMLVTERKVVLGRLRDGAFTEFKSRLWSELAPRAPVPFREPLGTAAFGVMSEGLYASVSDRGSVRLDKDLRVLSTVLGVPQPGRIGSDILCANAAPESAGFFGELRACTDVSLLPLAKPSVGLLSGPSFGVFGRFDALAFTAKPDASGLFFSASREPGGKLRVMRDGVPQALENVGAQLVAGDLDQDGEVELAFSQEAGDDAITIATFARDRIKDRLRLAARAGVHALAFCPPEALGKPALAAVVGDEVWLVR